MMTRVSTFYVNKIMKFLITEVKHNVKKLIYVQNVYNHLKTNKKSDPKKPNP